MKSKGSTQTFGELEKVSCKNCVVCGDNVRRFERFTETVNGVCRCWHNRCRPKVRIEVLA